MSVYRYLLCIAAGALIISACDVATTTVESCGDGFVDPGEDCDGNVGEETCVSLGHYMALGTLRCRPNCKYDLTECGGKCGDGVPDVNDGESCDGENLNGKSCQSLGYGGGTLVCKADCTFDRSGCTNACGNGYLEGGEGCDDGNQRNGDGCSSECQTEEGWSCENLDPSDCEPVCQDGQAVGTEECDKQDLRGETCLSLGFHGGELACTFLCGFDTELCEMYGRCGDGVLQPEHEICDGTLLAGETCTSQGYYAGTLSCAPDCQAFDMNGCAGRCGDGAVQGDAGELCDGTNLGGQTCSGRGFYGGTLACNPDCLGFNESACDGRCGDNVRQGNFGELCDGTDMNAQTCATRGFYGGVLLCQQHCLGFNTSGCIGSCGDGVVHTDYGEVCDGANLNGDSCVTRGFHGGQLVCAPNCMSFNQDNCVSVGRCGDSVVQGTYGEQCDGANLNGMTCASLGFNGGTLLCQTNCLFNLSGCQGSGNCGDGTVQTEYEQCDGTLLAGETCVSLGFYWGILSCNSSTCMFNTSQCREFCGDSIVQGTYGEECDGSNLAGQSCGAMGFHTGNLLCASDCQFDASGCALYCGDGILQADYEVCDGTLLGGETCNSMGFYQGNLACAPDCQGFVTTGCSEFCGDGIVNGIGGGETSEDCDGSIPPGTTCDTLGYFFGGSLACNSDCKFDDCNAVLEVSAGNTHTCAVLANGTARCWGNNQYGSLGDSFTTNSASPVVVSGLTNAVGISAGGSHTCAVLENGTARCWGRNSVGQLGDGTITQRTAPVAVSGLTGVVGISAGWQHTCAVLGDGTARCWGSNADGKLGDGTTTQRTTPVVVSGLTGAMGISAGEQHSCAVLGDGTARCWGNNDSGQLGDGTTTQRTTPVAVSGLTGAVGISAGRSHTCAVLGDGTARCWGSNGSGRLGDGSTTQRITPVVVSGLTGAVGISAGGEHTCAVLGDGTARCWGENGNGRIGDGTTNDRQTPRVVTGVSGSTMVSAGSGGGLEGHSCAVVNQGKHVKCWGDNSAGQLGDQSTTDRYTPVFIRKKIHLINEDFSAGLPAGWSVSGSVWEVGVATTGWPGEPCAATNLTGNYTYSMSWGNHCLTTGPIEVSNGLAATSLTFGSYMVADNGSDGGNVWIRIGAGTWTVLTNPTPAYTDTLGSQSAWSYSNTTFRPVFNLQTYVGSTIQLRFCFYSNLYMSNYLGWYIDDVELYAFE